MKIETFDMVLKLCQNKEIECRILLKSGEEIMGVPYETDGAKLTVRIPDTYLVNPGRFAIIDREQIAVLRPDIDLRNIPLIDWPI